MALIATLFTFVAIVSLLVGDAVAWTTSVTGTFQAEAGTWTCAVGAEIQIPPGQLQANGNGVLVKILFKHGLPAGYTAADLSTLDVSAITMEVAGRPTLVIAANPNLPHNSLGNGNPGLHVRFNNVDVFGTLLNGLSGDVTLVVSGPLAGCSFSGEISITYKAKGGSLDAAMAVGAFDDGLLDGDVVAPDEVEIMDEPPVSVGASEGAAPELQPAPVPPIPPAIAPATPSPAASVTPETTPHPSTPSPATTPAATAPVTPPPAPATSTSTPTPSPIAAPAPTPTPTPGPSVTSTASAATAAGDLPAAPEMPVADDPQPPVFDAPLPPASPAAPPDWGAPPAWQTPPTRPIGVAFLPMRCEQGTHICGALVVDGVDRSRDGQTIVVALEERAAPGDAWQPTGATVTVTLRTGQVIYEVCIDIPDEYRVAGAVESLRLRIDSTSTVTLGNTDTAIRAPQCPVKLAPVANAPEEALESAEMPGEPIETVVTDDDANRSVADTGVDDVANKPSEDEMAGGLDAADDEVITPTDEHDNNPDTEEITIVQAPTPTWWTKLIVIEPS